MHDLTDGGIFAQTVSNLILGFLCLLKYLAEAKMVHAIAKRRIIEEDLYECGLDVHHYLFFVCASILRIIGIISAQNMSLNVFSEIDSFAQKTTMPVIFLTNLC